MLVQFVLKNLSWELIFADKQVNGQMECLKSCIVKSQ